ncbi:MAG: hypothetical protein ACLTDF_06330 [Coprococcus sp.]
MSYDLSILPVSQRIKIIGGMDIAERKPQDGVSRSWWTGESSCP